MFKKFLLIVCGSFVGSFIAICIAVACMFALSFSIMMSLTKSSASIPSNSVMVVKLAGTINDAETSSSMGVIDLVRGTENNPSLTQIQKAFEVAKTESNIKGVVIDCQGVSAEPATLRAIREAVLDFKSCKKWVYAYANEGYMQGDYYVATAADSVVINPYGALDLHGLVSMTPYYKTALDNLGVEMQVVRVGSYKSAVEPFMLTQMSPENREQQEHYLGNIWKAMEGDIAKSRGMKVETLNTLVDSMMVTRSTDYLKQNKLIDKVSYRPEFEDMLKGLCDIKSTDDLVMVSPDVVATHYDDGSNKDGIIAVVYAEGEIDGSASLLGGGGGIDSEELVDVITDLQKDDDVKGLVLRVNSPGGSAFGSEQIWHALEKFKAAGKTFTVSMGGMAASGGYYISCGAQRIFADSTTITGSIGIFGVIPCAENLVENKLGIHTEIVETNENGEMSISGLFAKKLNPVQLQALQNYVNAGYETFTKRCADGRHMPQDSIKAIAQGRVWDGISAKQLKLVDEFGGLNDAISWTAKKAGLSTGYYKVQSYPGNEMSFGKLLKAYSNAKAEEAVKKEMGIFYTYYEQLQAILGRQHVLCLMEPVVIK